jgi:two-component system response regulator ResD
MAKILCVEDAPDTVSILQVLLKDHSPTFVSSVKEARRLLETRNFQLLLLDVNLPDGTGIDLMTQIFSEQKGIDVVFLTGRKDLETKATAFSLGAEDFIAKPFDPIDLKLRIDAKLRKRERSQLEKNQLKSGQLALYLDEHRAVNTVTNQALDLTTLEFRLLALFVRTTQKVFTRLEILDRVWGASVSVSERAVDVHVSNLRKKLTGTGVTISSVVGAGYRLELKNDV